MEWKWKHNISELLKESKAVLTGTLIKKVMRRCKLSELGIKEGTSILTLQKLKKLNKGIS